MQGDGSKGIVMLQCQAEIVVVVQKGLKLIGNVERNLSDLVCLFVSFLSQSEYGRGTVHALFCISLPNKNIFWSMCYVVFEVS